ncbi:MAG: tetratricopeptide repeat protein, partial [Proteobacteria bacterium]
NYFYERGLALTSAAEKGPTTWAEAKAPLEEAIAKDANIADAYYLLAETNLHLDDEAGALKNYTKAIETKPDELQYYGPLADLYMRLGKTDLAEQVLKEGLSFGKEGDKHLFAVHSLNGAVQESKGNMPGAISSYEAAKKACGQCNESGQAIAYFNLGIAYAQAKRNSEAIQQLASFDKIICKGAAATRYADQCAQSSQFGARLNGAGQ